MDNPNFRFAKADIGDREAINQLFAEEKPDMVVNFAAESHVDRSINNPGIFLETNILGTDVLMDACLKYGIKTLSSKFRRMRYMVICHWIDRICYLRKQRHYIQARHIVALRLQLIYWYCPILEPMDFR